MGDGPHHLAKRGQRPHSFHLLLQTQELLVLAHQVTGHPGHPRLQLFVKVTEGLLHPLALSDVPTDTHKSYRVAYRIFYEGDTHLHRNCAAVFADDPVLATLDVPLL